MKLAEHIWTTITVVVNWFTLSPFGGLDDFEPQSQLAISPKFDATHAAESLRVQKLYNIDPELEYEISSDGGGPKFRPPTGRPKGFPGHELKCDYGHLGPDWIPCSSAADRTCWLKNTKTGQQFNITTDYETAMPPGIVRNYNLVLTNQTINADGMPFRDGKVFSYEFPDSEDFEPTFPGPWIQACWGDVITSCKSEQCGFDVIADTQCHRVQQAAIRWQKLERNQYPLARTTTVEIYAFRRGQRHHTVSHCAE